MDLLIIYPNFMTEEIPTNKAMEAVYSREDEEIFQEVRDGTFNNTNKLKKISAEIAGILSKLRKDIRLDNLSTISPEAALELSKHRGGELYLIGLTSLSEVAAQSLSEHTRTVFVSPIIMKEWVWGSISRN